MALTTHTVTLTAYLPGSSLPLDGTWTVSAANDPALFKDTSGGVIFAGTRALSTTAGTAVFTLPRTGQAGLLPLDGKWRLSFKSKSGTHTLGPYVFPLTANMTLSDIAAVTGTTITPSLVEQAQAIKNSLLALGAPTQSVGIDVDGNPVITEFAGTPTSPIQFDGDGQPYVTLADTSRRLVVEESLRALATQLVPSATRTAPPFQTGSGLSDGVLTGGTAAIRHQAVRTIFGPRIAYSNHYPEAPGGASETAGPVPITVRASLEYPSGVLFPVTFGGATSVVIQPGATVVSDPLGIDFAKGVYFWTRTYVSVTSGQKFPRGGHATHSAFGEWHNYSAAGGTDLTASGTAPATGFNEYVYSPSAILGTPIDPGKAVLAIVGDSIVAGTGDDQTGWVSRLLGTNYSHQKVAYPSESMVKWATGDKAFCYRRAGVLARVGVTHVLAEHIVNDLGASSLPTLQANAFNYWRFLSRIGRTYAVTCTPQTTSTDAWVTVANQTVGSPGLNEPRRIAWNAWVRDGAPMTAAGAAQAVGATGGTVLRAGNAGHPLTGWFEVADAAESARDSGKWKANYTGDGTHPNANGAAQIAATLTAAVTSALGTTSS